MKANQANTEKRITLGRIECGVPFSFVDRVTGFQSSSLRQGIFIKVAEHTDFIMNVMSGALYVIGLDYENEDETEEEHSTFCDCDEVIPYPNSILNLQR